MSREPPWRMGSVSLSFVTPSPVVTTVMNYQVGSNEALPGFPGMAHAQEHMMFRGSPGLSADQLADISAAMGGKFNAERSKP